MRRAQAAESVDERVQVIEDGLLVGEPVELVGRDLVVVEQRQRPAEVLARPATSDLADSRTSSSRKRSRFFSSSV